MFSLMSVIAGNPTTPNDYDASAPDSRIPALVTVGVVVVVVALVLSILCLVKLQSHNQPQRDVERAKRKLKETIDLRMLNDASPSQKYEQIQGFKREAAVASTQSSAAEVCAICLEVLVDVDSVRRLKCNHLFHTTCIDSWLKNRHVDCPLCKSIFIPTEA
ncbi:uncharacterized protein B0I36DRAFT_43486 [Microdochium trichocladiopsis]|uniref:RING-type domain-containing protein n=1 Tax=Microdochium trichocladiopsis TaxID=1682393 RepID=A0A9P8XW46_9PEZI|nr:uncharacterized protein B0I36DRAFT_43486 [Microdochium trichocladiopsis]KAH7016176.1 hypothetical protein B0I36DRAFT_43486 [Microdochium trichocladiopsis]